MHQTAYQKKIVGRIDHYRSQARSDARSGVLARWMLGVATKFMRNGTIYGENEPVDYVYEVVRGAIRTVKILPNERRQIGGFYFDADIFGLEHRNEHAFSAEAIVDSEILAIERSALIRLAGHGRELADQLLIKTGDEIARQHNHALMLIKRAEERLGSFLLEMAGRTSKGHLIELPMSRQDIADYLGVTIETVSRTFRILADSSTIRLPSSRAVILRDRSVLEDSDRLLAVLARNRIHQAGKLGVTPIYTTKPVRGNRRSPLAEGEPQ